MALMIGWRPRVTTAAGVIVSGGKVRVYNTGTTNLSTLYSNAALTVPLTNPVVAASDGFTSQIFAADGLAVDVDFLTAGDVVISGQSLVGAVFVGSSSSSLLRDFTNSRFQASGAGGIMSLEAGDPTGDDVGGNWRFGGWNGTQAVTGSLDAATVNATGLFTVQGKPLMGIVGAGATTSAAAATQAIALPVSLTGVNAWEIFCWNLTHTADSHLKAVLSFDGGLNYKTGASDYSTMNLCAHDSAVASYNDAAEAYIHLTDTVTVKGGATGNLFLRVITPASGSGATSVNGEYTTASSTASLPAKYTFGAGTSFTTATHIQLSASSGNISFSYMVRSLLGFS